MRRIASVGVSSAQRALHGARFLLHDPDVLGQRVARQAAGQCVFLGQGAGEAAGEGAPADAIEGHEHAQRDRFGLQSTLSGARGDGRCRSDGGGIGGWVRGHAGGEFLAFRGRQHHRHNRRRVAVGRRADHPAFEIAQHGAHHGALTEPEGGLACELQILTEQPAGERGEERGESGGFGQAPSRGR